ncbi:MAG: type II toxin-antitoxin system death-on-curing family toxin [Actinomycetes bacterium]|jgi:death-on-curing protein
MDIDFLSLEDLLKIADGVIPGYQVRDFGLLESAVMRPQATVFGELAYPTLATQTGALIHSLARNHALIDGNKRIAWSAMRIFLMMNDVQLHYTIDDAEEFVLAIARGEREVADIAEWIAQHTSP